MSYAIPGAATDLETLQNAATTNANGSELEVLGHSIVVFEVSKTGSPTFTVNFEGSIDGTTYVALECQTILDGTKVTTATAVGQFRSDCSGLQSVRARTSGVSGADADNNVTVKARALPIPVGSMLADVSISAETITTNLAGDDSDLDSGAGTDNHDVVAIGVAASGGHAVITGDAANGLDVDVTRSALPTGAATEAEQATQTASLSVLDDWDESDRAKVNTIAGQVGVEGGAGASTALTQRVAIASDANVVDTELTTADLDSGAGTDTRAVVGLVGTASGGGQLIPGDTTNGLDVDVTRVSGTVSTLPTAAATPTVTAVADSAINVTLLAANANRFGAMVTNDSSARLYVKLGATATTASYTVSLAQHGYYEVPFGYTGVIDGIWSSDPGDGAARVTEVIA